METEESRELYQPEMATITAIKQMTEQERWFEVKLPNGRDLGHKPLQFVELSIFGVGEAPFSITSSPTKKGHFEMCIRVAGNLTRYLMKLKTGDKIGIRGPFGNGLDPVELAGKDILIGAGGIGLVPLRSLIDYIADRRSDFGRVTIFYGCRNPDEILYKDDIEAWKNTSDIDFHITVDRPNDTWKGNVGVITELFHKVELDAKNATAIVIGPPIMFKFMILELYRHSFLAKNIYMSLERRMKCGVGKCGHCQIGRIYTCQDGPVFRYDQIRGVKEAL